MKIIDQSFEILTDKTAIMKMPAMIELAGRTCYKSENRITNDSSTDFCRMLIRRGHDAMIEHGSISVKFITDRGVSHELVRHRIASYAQESTRYVNYENDDIQFIRPAFDWANPALTLGAAYNGKMVLWIEAMQSAEESYKDLSTIGCSPQEARSVLPNSLKTEIICTMNIREWRSMLKLRVAKAAHPQIRKLMIPLLDEFTRIVPCLFGDIKEDEE